jgi:hypothetical protein
MEPNIDLTRSHLCIDGQFVSAKISRIVEAIRDYSEELDVQWLPPQLRTDNEAAFKIIHRAPGQPPYTLFHITNDEDFDERVLARIIANDQRTRPVQLSELEAWEEAQARINKQKFLDDMEEAADKAAFMLRTPLHTYTIPGRNGRVKKIRE